VFAALPESVQQRAAGSLELIALHPRMYPIRRRGIMRGYRYFLASGYLFYYSVSSTEARVSAIIPAVMRKA
jgi:plasmid stabilization system protein ParE